MSIDGGGAMVIVGLYFTNTSGIIFPDIKLTISGAVTANEKSKMANRIPKAEFLANSFLN